MKPHYKLVYASEYWLFFRDATGTFTSYYFITRRNFWGK